MFIYCLKDPRTGCLRYLGQSKDPRGRWWGHCSPAKTDHSHKANWIRSLLKLGLKPTLEVLEEAPSEAADDTERFWIASLRAAGVRLLNHSDGGEGNPGFPRPDVSAMFKGVRKSEVTKQRMKAAKTAAVRAAVSHFHTGRKRPALTGARISAAIKGKPMTAAKLAALALAHKAVREKAKKRGI